MPTRDHPNTARAHRRPWIAPMIVAAALLVAPSTGEAAPTTDVERDAAPTPIEVLRLDCRAVEAPVNDVSDSAHGVRCRWSVPAAGDAAGVRLLRVVVGQDTPRTQIFSSRDLQVNTHLDAPLRPNHRYAYRVQALSETGRVVSSSRTITVAVPQRDVEQLRGW